jgi:3',5'-cyclic AMP phosphodiesterase CpdA
MSLTRRELVLAALTASAALPLSASWASPGRRRSTLRIVFFTDVHTRLEWGTPEALALAARHINGRRPELILAGGDLITDGFQSSAASVRRRWDAYMAMHSSLRAPVAAALGNHDLVAAIPEDGTPPAKDPRTVFRERLGEESTYRSFNANGYHIVILDSISVVGGELKYVGHIDEPQLDWLRRDLESVDTDTPIVVLTHIPLLTAFYQATEGATSAAQANRVITNNVEVLQAFSRHNLTLVLQGHLHVEEQLQWRGTRFITGGAVCGKWWRGPWYGTPEGFGVVTLRPTRIDWEYVSYDWTARRP